MLNRHPYCKITHCDICLEDMEALEEHLRLKTGIENMDHLSKYRSFIDKRLGKNTETEWGGAIPEVFEDGNIEAYIKIWTED